MENKICPRCGTANERDSKFCVGCANQFVSGEAGGNLSSIPTNMNQRGAYQSQSQGQHTSVAQNQPGRVVNPMEPINQPGHRMPPAPPQNMYTGGNMQNNQFNAQPMQHLNMNLNNQYEMPYSVGKWVGLLLLQILLPGLGSIIALIICLTSDNATVRNFGKAQLILIIIGVVLSIIGFILVIALGGLAGIMASL